MKVFNSYLLQQTNPNELNHTNDGFLNAILNDEDLQLMDMAVNEGNDDVIIYTVNQVDLTSTDDKKDRTLDILQKSG